MFMAMASASAEPTEAYKTLSMHALNAIEKSNTNALSALLKEGFQINELLFHNGRVLDFPLHYAVRGSANLGMIQFLLDNGADRDKRNQFGERPIDIVYKRDHSFNCPARAKKTNTNAKRITNTRPNNKTPQCHGSCGIDARCKILAKPEGAEKMIAGFPEEMLEELFKWTEFRDSRADEPLFGVTLNGVEAPSELMEWLKQYYPDIRPATQAEYPTSTTKDGRVYQSGAVYDKDTKEHGSWLRINFTKTQDGYEWAITYYAGMEAASGTTGTLIKKYGYWMRSENGFWVS